MGCVCLCTCRLKFVLMTCKLWTWVACSPTVSSNQHQWTAPLLWRWTVRAWNEWIFTTIPCLRLPVIVHARTREMIAFLHRVYKGWSFLLKPLLVSRLWYCSWQEILSMIQILLNVLSFLPFIVLYRLLLCAPPFHLRTDPLSSVLN